MNTDFIHPLDREMADKVLQSSVVKGFFKTIFDEQMDDINSYIHAASLYRLENTHMAVNWLNEGCELFDVAERPPVYIVRSYQYDVICTGYEKTIVQIPNILLENADPDILRGRMMTAAASIKADHHKLRFLLWILREFSGIISVPLVQAATKGLLYEWYRSQYYTCDRAFYTATQNAELSLKNILYGEVSPEILNNFDFGKNGTFEDQVERFFSTNTIVEGLSNVGAFFQRESWLPARYRELQKYCKRGHNSEH